MAGPPPGWLREARWLTAQRAMLHGGVLGLLTAAYLAVAVLRVIHGPGPGEPTDFLAYYAASIIALGGDAATAWDPVLHGAVQQSVMPSGDLRFSYPPPFLLLSTPLALLSYRLAYCLWVLVTFGLCLLVLLRHRAGPAPALAGVVVAGLAIKPQLGLVVLPALLAARRWRVIASATVVGVFAVLLSGIGLGWASWPAFLSGLSLAAAGLQQGAFQLWQV